MTTNWIIAVSTHRDSDSTWDSSAAGDGNTMRIQGIELLQLKHTSVYTAVHLMLAGACGNVLKKVRVDIHILSISVRETLSCGGGPYVHVAS